LVLFLMGLYIWIAYKVVRRVSPVWGKALLVLVFVLIPTADALWGRYVTLSELCKDAGLQVFQKASKEGGLLEYRNPDDHWIRTAGIAFSEGKLPSTPYSRLSIVDGKPLLERDVTPKSKYVLTEWETVSIGKDDSFTRHELRIENRVSGESIARYRGYHFSGGWVERFLGSFADSGPQGARCTVPAFNIEILIQSAFN